MYEVQVYKLNQKRTQQKDQRRRQPATSRHPPKPKLAEQKKHDQATAARIAGDLFVLPKNQRMAALIKLPVPDRIAFTTYVAGDQQNLLLADFNPREREIFNAMAANIGASYQIVNELSQAKFLRAILSERQLQEVMTDFWFNHFNVYIGKDSDQWYTTAYERDVIRKNALGKFRDLLLATAQSPAMMVYLDNWQSIGPDSLANGVNPANPKSKKGNRGLNENYGREVMELHTVGVNGGYTQADVTALSAILTGWTVDRPNQAGPFLFDPKTPRARPQAMVRPRPSPADATSGSTTIPARPCTAGMNEGIEALTILAASPKTAHFISYKLAQRFVADDPPPALVDRMAATYLSTDGDIKAILRTLVQSPEFNSTDVLPQQGQNSAWSSSPRPSAPPPPTRQPRRPRQHHQHHGHAALLRPSAHRLLHHRRPLDELHRPRRSPQLRLRTHRQQVRQPEVRLRPRSRPRPNGPARRLKPTPPHPPHLAAPTLLRKPLSPPSDTPTRALRLNRSGHRPPRPRISSSSVARSPPKPTNSSTNRSRSLHRIQPPPTPSTS